MKGEFVRKGNTGFTLRSAAADEIHGFSSAVDGSPFPVSVSKFQIPEGETLMAWI